MSGIAKWIGAIALLILALAVVGAASENGNKGDIRIACVLGLAIGLGALALVSAA